MADNHTYFVGEYGVLVHNSYTKTDEVEPYDTVDYADKHTGLENHHGVLEHAIMNSGILMLMIL